MPRQKPLRLAPWRRRRNYLMKLPGNAALPVTRMYFMLCARLDQLSGFVYILFRMFRIFNISKMYYFREAVNESRLLLGT